MRCATYIRVSTERQVEEGYSIDFQRESLDNFAKSKRWEIIKDYIDEGISGRTVEREKFQEMLLDARNGLFDVILIYKLDRFSRSLQDLLNVIETLKKHNVYVSSVTQSYDDSTPEGTLMRNMLGSFAQFESQMIGVRVRDGMDRRARSGGWNTKAPYGYDLNGGELVINTEEAAIVEMIFGLYNRGNSMTEIATRLNHQQITTKSGSAWGPKSVLRILDNPVYTGHIRYNDELVSAEHQPVIDVKIFNRVQKRRTKNVRGEGRRKRMPTKIKKTIPPLSYLEGIGENNEDSSQYPESMS